MHFAIEATHRNGETPLQLDMDAPLPRQITLGRCHHKLRRGVAIVCCNGVSPLPWGVATTNYAGALPSSVATARTPSVH